MPLEPGDFDDLPPELHIGKGLWVARQGDEQWYRSSLEDVRENEFLISIPYLQQVPLIINRGEKVNVRYAGEGASYSFLTECLGRTTDTIPLYRLLRPARVERIQLRRFVRFSEVLEVYYAIDDGGQNLQFSKTTSVDISAGGMRLVVPQLLPVGTRLALRFYLKIKNRLVEFAVAGRVVRQVVVETPKGPVYQVGVEFVSLNRAQQDQIVSYIFHRMAEKGRLR